MLHLLRIATSSCKLWQNYFLQKCKHCKTARRPICCLRMRRRGAGVVAMRTNISKGKEYYMLTCLLAPSLSKVGVGGNIRGRTRGEPTRPTERVDGELAIARVRHFRLEGCTEWGYETSSRKWNRGCNGLHQLGQPVAPSIQFPGRCFTSPVCIPY